MMTVIRNRVARQRHQPSFTLVELLVVITIIAILSSTVLVALYEVLEDAKEAHTRTQIAKLHELIMFRWEGYRTRQVPIQIPAVMSARPESWVDANGNCWWDPNESQNNPDETYPGTTYDNGIYDYGRARIRLLALRELMRMELPERIADLMGDPTLSVQPDDNPRRYRVELQDGTSNFIVLQMTPPSLLRTYQRKADRLIKAFHGPTASWRQSQYWTRSQQNAECLYLIVSSMRDGDTSALDFFRESEIQDTDEDGMPEIVDGWGQPIQFLRWAPGFATNEGFDGGYGVAGVDDDGNGTIDDLSELGWWNSDDASDLQVPAWAPGPDAAWGAASVDDDGDGVVDNCSEMGFSNTDDILAAPDPFDTLRVDLRWAWHKNDPTRFVHTDSANDPKSLYPLIFSAGRDGDYDTAAQPNGELRYAHPQACNDPYQPVYIDLGNSSIRTLAVPMGKPGPDPNVPGYEPGFLDNITNHQLDVR